MLLVNQLNKRSRIIIELIGNCHALSRKSKKSSKFFKIKTGPRTAPYDTPY